MATPTPSIILPVTGVARVKSVLSGDTVVLLGKPIAPHLPQPEVIFTFEAVNAPRYDTQRIRSACVCVFAGMC
jgi:staphylococcal nuclease domain-containing protein 1